MAGSRSNHSTAYDASGIIDPEGFLQSRPTGVAGELVGEVDHLAVWPTSRAVGTAVSRYRIPDHLYLAGVVHSQCLVPAGLGQRTQVCHGRRGPEKSASKFRAGS